MSKDKQPEKPILTDAQLLGRVITIFIISVGLGAFTMTKCDGPATPPQPESSLLIQNAKLNSKAKYWANEAMKWKAKRQPIIDSTNKSVENHYHYYTTVIPELPDTCKHVISHYKRMRDITDSLLTIQIDYQDSTIMAQDSVILARNGQLSNDTIIFNQNKQAMTDTIKYYKKQVRRRGFKRIVQAGLAGIVGGLIIGSQIKN